MQQDNSASSLNAETNDAPTSPEVKTALAYVAAQELLVNMSQALARKTRLSQILAVGFILMGLMAGIGFFRHPRVVVAVQSADGQRIVSIDDQKFGETEQIQMGVDNLTNRDKAELINNWCQRRYAVDLASRSKDVPFFLTLMVPQTASLYFKKLNESGELQQERDEGFSGSWKTDSLEVDRNDKNIVQVIGTRLLRRTVSGKPKQERIQYKIVFTLHTEGKRDDTPLRSGYWIYGFSDEILSRTEES